MIRIIGKNKNGLRRQPRLKRMNTTSAAIVPKVVVPVKAKKRRRRNNRPIHIPVSSLKSAVVSARWMSLVLLATCVWALLTVGQAETFYLSDIKIEGSAGFREAELIEASGLAGKHVFDVEPSVAAAQINDVPGVLSATVTVQWPNYVTVQVAEEVPVAMWRQSGANYWVTETGHLISARGDAAGLLQIESEDIFPVIEGDRVPMEVLKGALLLKQLRANIEKLQYSEDQGISYQDGRGWRGYFGVGEDMAQKLVIYETVVDYLLEKQVSPEYISVKYKDRPFYKPSGGL